MVKNIPLLHQNFEVWHNMGKKMQLVFELQNRQRYASFQKNKIFIRLLEIRILRQVFRFRFEVRIFGHQSSLKLQRYSSPEITCSSERIMGEVRNKVLGTEKLCRHHFKTNCKLCRLL